jgi:hypothetical protein
MMHRAEQRWKQLTVRVFNITNTMRTATEKLGYLNLTSTDHLRRTVIHGPTLPSDRGPL